ncbi:tripartite motif-containing protein 3-like isoform X2 [Cimex lectularius]|nr:tripartite motif-containing protein 3-like isoform X2 [Cimex lectularius]XP_024082917.1 tripartite motif-containing protein 3-like isoform X2 [Cimex lectularius]
MYDGGEHTPKLLPCSHTVCLHCLSRIAAQVATSPTFRCPICRESITVPRGGVAALPPSFLVNQLLDLMASQRREIVPKCSVHFNQELLFCETCDTVFCAQCTSGSHSSSGNDSCEHTVIPFSIAIKRMSEILLYKANECISKLSEAEDAVKGEVTRLESATRACIDHVETLFNEAKGYVEARRLAVVDQINKVRETKMKELNSQLSTIQAEKDKVTTECDGLQYQVEVRNISQRISALTQKLESVSCLAEPRENCFITCEIGSSSLNNLTNVLKDLGSVRTTTTFPSLSSLSLIGDCVVNLESTVMLVSYDYGGVQRTEGGDPVSAIVQLTNSPTGSQGSPIDVKIEDLENGTYHIKFRPPAEGMYEVKVTVVDRQVGKGPLIVTATKHNNPNKIYGTRGSEKDQFLQPVSITYDQTSDKIFVVDTGNCRIKILSRDLELIGHIENDCLQGRSCTGIACYCPPQEEPWLALINWRTRIVTRLNTEGETLSCFTYADFQEPIDIAVDNNYGHILIADNGPCCVFVFDIEGKFLFRIGAKGNQDGFFNPISSVCVGSDGQIIVADSRVQIFSAKGDFLRVFHSEGKGRYGGLTVDNDGRLVGSRCEKASNFVQVMSLKDGKILATIDSHLSKFKRPSGLTITSTDQVVVVDHDCVKKYREMRNVKHSDKRLQQQLNEEDRFPGHHLRDRTLAQGLILPEQPPSRQVYTD